METEYCCEIMKQQLTNICPQHGQECGDNVIRICKGQFFEGRLMLVAPNAEYDLSYCPWCGTKLQDSIEEMDRDRPE